MGEAPSGRNPLHGVPASRVAVLQVPVGVLLDRFGARKLIVVGAFTMAAGQLVLAVATGALAIGLSIRPVLATVTAVDLALVRVLAALRVDALTTLTLGLQELGSRWTVGLLAWTTIAG